MDPPSREPFEVLSVDSSDEEASREEQVDLVDTSGGHMETPPPTLTIGHVLSELPKAKTGNMHIMKGVKGATKIQTECIGIYFTIF